MAFLLSRPRWYKLLIVVGWLPFVALCLYNQPYLDDYWTGRLGREQGIWQPQAWLFQHWTGRFASTLACVALNPLSYGWLSGVKLTACLNILLKGGMLWLALRRFSQQHLAKLEALWLAAGLALVYVCLVPDKYATLYSFTDWAVYQLPAAVLLLVPVALDGMQRAARPAQRRRWGVAAAVGTVTAAGSNEMTLTLLGWLLLTGLGVSLYRRQTHSARIWAGLLFMLLLAGAVALSAPGNYERLQTYGSAPIAGVLAVGRHWAQSVAYIFTLPTTLLIVALPLVLVPLGIRLLPGRAPGFRLPLGVGAVVVVVGTALGALPYSIIEQPLERPVNVLQWWMLLGWLGACWASLPQGAPPRYPQAVRNLVAVMLGVALTFPVGRAWLELTQNAPSYARQWQARRKTLELARTQGHREVNLAPIVGIEPRHTLIRGYDNQPDARNVRNANLAAWYGVDSVRTDPARMAGAYF